MPNPRYNNMHGANVKSTGGASNKAAGASASVAMNEKTAAWPGVPGKTQSKDRSGGVPKTGHRGKFYVKSEGL